MLFSGGFERNFSFIFLICPFRKPLETGNLSFKNNYNFYCSNDQIYFVVLLICRFQDFQMIEEVR